MRKGFKKGYTPWNKGKKGLTGWWTKGRKAWNKGLKFPENEGENSSQWKGEKVGYVGLHMWIKKKLGQPNECEFCHKIIENNRYIHWANKSHEYKRDLDDWIRLCKNCHNKYDLAYRLDIKYTYYIWLGLMIWEQSQRTNKEQHN